MPRYAKQTTLDWFKGKVQPIIDGDFPYEISSQLEKDLSKISFDFENTDWEDGFSGYPCGWKVLPNGLPVLFVNAGGDWEHPICFVLYWDGKSVRGYIPEKGNVFNRKEKCAYGSEESGEGYDESKIEKPDPNAIIRDVMDRIIIIGHE